MTYTIAFSCVCTSPLAVMTIVGLHDFVKVFISASLRSFFLIICIDALESTTNSFSSGFNVDAGRHLFSGDEKNAALSCSFNLPASTLLRGHLALATLSLLVKDPQISERWGYAHEVHLDKCNRAKDFGLEFVWRAIAFVNFKRWIGLCMFVLFRRIDFGGFMFWNTQPNCRASDDRRSDEFCPNFLSLLFPGFSGRSWHSSVTGSFFCQFPFFSIVTALLSSCFLDLSVGCSSTWRCAYEHFSPNRQALWVL